MVFSLRPCALYSHCRKRPPSWTLHVVPVLLVFMDIPCTLAGCYVLSHAETRRKQKVASKLTLVSTARGFQCVLRWRARLNTRGRVNAFLIKKKKEETPTRLKSECSVIALSEKKGRAPRGLLQHTVRQHLLFTQTTTLPVKDTGLKSLSKIKTY